MKLARISDLATGICRAHTSPQNVLGTIVVGDGTVTAEKLGVAHLGDLVSFSCGHCGTIVSGTSTVKASGRGIAQIGDIVVGPMQATIISAANTVTGT